MKPLPSRPDPSLTERTPQRREDEGLPESMRPSPLSVYAQERLRSPDAPVFRRPGVRPVLTVTTRVHRDPNPMPRFRLFRWLP